MEDREIGAKIRQLRLAKGLRMEDLARAADVAQSTLSYIERGSNPSAGTLKRILDALSMTWSEFFGEDPAQSLTSEDRPIPEADLDAYLRQHDLWFKGQPLTYAEKLAARQAIELLRKAMEASKEESEGEDQGGKP